MSTAQDIGGLFKGISQNISKSIENASQPLRFLSAFRLSQLIENSQANLAPPDSEEYKKIEVLQEQLNSIIQAGEMPSSSEFASLVDEVKSAVSDSLIIQNNNI